MASEKELFITKQYIPKSVTIISPDIFKDIAVTSITISGYTDSSAYDLYNTLLVNSDYSKYKFSFVPVKETVKVSGTLRVSE